MTTRLNLRVLTVFGIVAVPLLVVAMALAMGAGRAGLRESSSRRLAQTAELLASSTDVYVNRRIIDASVLARVPTVLNAAAAANAAAFDAARVRAIDQGWQAGRPLTAGADRVLTNDAARFLADVTRQNPIYREVLLTDRSGRLAAASQRTSDYFQADEEWWKEAFGDGVRGRVFVTGTVYDESAQSHSIQIAVPVGADPVAGVLKIVTDIRELAAAVTFARIGETGNAKLVRPDGSMVLSSGAFAGPAERFFAADALRQQLAAVRQGQESLFQLHFTVDTPGGATRLVGVAPSQLGLSYPNLNWLVAVSQHEREVFAEADALATRLLLILAVSALTMFILAVLFSSWLALPPIPRGFHLSSHPAVRRTDDGAEIGV